MLPQMREDLLHSDSTVFDNYADTSKRGVGIVFCSFLKAFYCKKREYRMTFAVLPCYLYFYRESASVILEIFGIYLAAADIEYLFHKCKSQTVAFLLV